MSKHSQDIELNARCRRISFVNAWYVLGESSMFDVAVHLPRVLGVKRLLETSETGIRELSFRAVVSW